MSITINLTPQEIADLKALLREENEANAVVQAAREYIRLQRLRELKQAAGKFEFDSNGFDDHLQPRGADGPSS